MRLKRNSIRKRLLTSYAALALAVLFVTAFGLTTLTNIYFQNITLRELERAESAVDEQLISDIFSFRNTESAGANLRLYQSLIRLTNNVSKYSNLLSIDYLILEDNFTLIYPIDPDDETRTILERDIIPWISATKTFTDEQHTFVRNKIKYVARTKVISDRNGVYKGILMTYSNSNNIDSLMELLTILMLSIFALCLLLATIISFVMARRISKPIEALCQYVNEIGKRNFNAPIPKKFFYDEVGELTENIVQMSDKLENHDRTLRTFFQNASHELRTPLTSIQGYAEGIKCGVFDNNSEAAEVIDSESRRLNEIVGDLLYLSKIEGIDEHLNIQSFNAKDLADDCADEVSAVAKLAEKKLLFTVEQDLMIKGDYDLLLTAVKNIVTNCIRYAKSQIEIRLKSSGKNVIISICDDGNGIDEQDIDHIFERFYKGKSGKTGLGLSIAMAIVERHYGKITAYNNNGACFEIQLPQ